MIYVEGIIILLMIHCTVQWRTPAPSVRTLAPIQDRFVATLALELRALLLLASQFGHFLLDISQQRAADKIAALLGQ